MSIGNLKKKMKIYDVMIEYCKFSAFRGVCYSTVLWVFTPYSITNLSFSTNQKHVQSPWRRKKHILTKLGNKFCILHGAKTQKTIIWLNITAESATSFTDWRSI